MLLLALLVACGRAAPEPSSPMARDQLFFVGHDPDPLLLALVFQRHRAAPGASLEAKAFAAWKGEWVTPFWERVEVAAWPGDGLEPALTAWQEARSAANLRLSWSDAEAGLQVKLRGRSAAIELSAETLAEAGVGEGPHGPLAWRAGPGLARVDGREVRGLLVAERLVEGRVPEPVFGRFELWLLGDGGDLVLGRRTLSDPGPGRALRVAPDGRALLEDFEPRTHRTRADPETGFALPTSWSLGPRRFERRGGELGRGLRPGGGPAVYDVSHAVEDAGAASALVLHLQDEAGSEAGPD